MIPHSSLRLVTWILERLDLADEALVGDLVEAHHAGRSNGWVWRQTALAIGVGLGREIGGHKLAAAGAVGGSLVAISLSTSRNEPKRATRKTPTATFRISRRPLSPNNSAVYPLIQNCTTEITEATDIAVLGALGVLGG